MIFRNGINFAKSLHFCKIKTAAALIARGSRRLRPRSPIFVNAGVADFVQI